MNNSTQLSLGFLNRADGSAGLNLGKTSVICGIFGPTEIKVRDEILGKATIDVVFKPQTGLAGTAEKRFELILKETIESLIITSLHPRTLIQLNFQTVCNDGSLLSTTFNAAFLALINAGIPLNDSFASITVAILPNNQLKLNPTSEEEKDSTSIHIFVFSQNQEGACCTQSEGAFTQEQFVECFNYAQSSISQVFSKLRTLLSSS